MKIVTACLSVSFALTAFLTEAQGTLQKWELGVQVGMSGYLGDLNKSDIFSKEPKPSISLLGRYHFNERWALRASIVSGSLSGSDANYPQRATRGFKTFSPVMDLTAAAEWDFLGKKHLFTDDDNTSDSQDKPKNHFSAYLLLGVGLAFTNPKPDFSGTSQTEAYYIQGAIRDKAAFYSNTHLVIPIGVGVRYEISQHWVLGAEAVVRVSFSDYLDGVSKAGNSQKNDKYKISGLTLSYRFKEKDKKLNCP